MARASQLPGAPGLKCAFASSVPQSSAWPQRGSVFTITTVSPRYGAGAPDWLRCEPPELTEADHRARHEGDVTCSVFPVSRYKVIGLLDELALGAGRGEPPHGVRRAVIDVCEALRVEVRPSSCQSPATSSACTDRSRRRYSG